LPDEPTADGEPPDDDVNRDEDDDAGDGPWVTVATFWQAPAVHIARLRLESAGIDCAILDENLIATDWYLANAAGGIKLQVPASRATLAVELLGKRPGAAAADGEPLFDGQTRCPKCGGGDIYPVRLSRRLVFLSVLLLGAPLPILARKTRCAACGFEWR
jgi:hypothetical protein